MASSSFSEFTALHDTYLDHLRHRNGKLSTFWVYYFKNECECFTMISKHGKTDESTRPLQPSAFIVFECLEIVMKHDARVFEMTSLKKQYKIMQCCIFL